MIKSNRVFFLSHIVNMQTPLYGGKSNIIIRSVKSIKEGGSSNTMFWSFPNHIGTHIDAPLHFIVNGKSVSEMRPKDLIFTKVKLIILKKIKPGYTITSDDLKGLRDCDLLLLKTSFEKYRGKKVFWNNSVSLGPDLASWLKNKCPSLRAVGIDSLSISNISRKEIGRQAHKAFLGRGILLVEDMKLSDLRKDPDAVIITPMMVEGADASPCTVLAFNN